MTDLRDAAKLALEALEFVLYPQKKQHEAIAALRRALAEDAMDKMAENARELGLDKDYARGYVAGMDSQMFANDTSQERVDKAEDQRYELIGHADLGINNIYLFNEQEKRVVPNGRQPIYTRPQPKREWVGLTQEELLEAAQLAERDNYLVAFQRIQQKLKEKND